MRNFHVYAARKFCPTINIDKLWTLVPQETKDQLSKDKAPVIDCVRAVSACHTMLWNLGVAYCDFSVRIL